MLKTKTPLISGGGIYKIYTLDPYRVLKTGNPYKGIIFKIKN